MLTNKCPCLRPLHGVGPAKYTTTCPTSSSSPRSPDFQASPRPASQRPRRNARRSDCFKLLCCVLRVCVVLPWRAIVCGGSVSPSRLERWRTWISCPSHTLRLTACHLRMQCHATSTEKDTNHASTHPLLPPSLPSHRPHAMRGTQQQRSRLRLLPVLLLSSACLLLPALAATSEELLESVVAHPRTTPALYTNEGPSNNQPALPTLWAGILDLSKPCQQGE